MSETPRTDEHLRMKEENGHVVIVSRGFARQLETELAAARARITILEGCINDMTEEQAAICAEGQSITELVAAKDRLIEQMRDFIVNLSKQKTTDEMNEETFEDADFEGGYDYIVEDARRIKAALETVEKGGDV